MTMQFYYQLYTTFAPEKRPAFAQRIRQTGLLAVWAGALPLIHTHSFLALGLCSLGMMVYAGRICWGIWRMAHSPWC